MYERCAAIDVGKDEIAVAVRMPGDESFQGAKYRRLVNRMPKNKALVATGN